jgi:hypothetical protein
MRDITALFIVGVLFGAVLMLALLVFMMPSPSEIGCNFVGKTLDKRTVLVDNSDCLIETESGFITLKQYIGE